ncbi:MAG: hypothetical protein ACRBN8_12330 [Nannocystales bacterium]
MSIVAVKDLDGLLLGLAISGDPDFQDSVGIEHTDAGCSVDETGVIPLCAVYTLEDSTLELLGAGEGLLETSDGVYRVRQEALGTQVGNPDMPDFVTATVFLES